MSDKRKRINNAGRTPEPVVKRPLPFGGEHAARESQRKATAHGRARGNA